MPFIIGATSPMAALAAIAASMALPPRSSIATPARVPIGCSAATTPYWEITIERACERSWARISPAEVAISAAVISAIRHVRMEMLPIALDNVATTRDRAWLRSARIILDHEVRLHLHRIGHLAEMRDAGELGRHLLVIDLDIIGHVALGERGRLDNKRELLRFLLDLDHIADLHAHARNGDTLAIHGDVAVADELACREHGRHEFGAIDHRVEPALQEPDQVGAGIALHPDRLVVDAAELLLGNIAVIAAQLLLGLELHAVVGELALAALAVLAGPVFAVVDGTLWAAPDILAHAAVDLVLRLVALGHRVLMFSCAVVEDRALLCPGAGPKPTGPWPKRRQGPR